MNPERWTRIDNLLQAALERPPAERDAFLRAACGGDAALEEEVRSLLASHRQAGSFLESPALEVAAQSIARQQNHTAGAALDALAGQTVSHYRVLEKLGQGGMGVVYKARDIRLNRLVALKFLATRVSDPERRRRFMQEARAASALSHPHIVTIYDIGEAGGTDFIAMEFVPGRALDALIAGSELRRGSVLDYAIQIAGALAAAHEAGILHRDLKPANLMLSDSGGMKVLDFGLAKLIGLPGALQSTPAMVTTQEGTIAGTVFYMSPEQAEGRHVDARSDIFSFGAVLYEMLTGRRAFPGESVSSVLAAILRDEPGPLLEIAPAVPRQLDRIVRRCLEKDPGRRYQHAGDLRIDLEQVKEDLAAGARGAASAPAATPRRMRRWWQVGAAAALAVAALLVARYRDSGPAPTPWKLSRLTSDAGLAGYAALSPDGSLIAYSSDSGPEGGRDLYIKQVTGGPPVRLTFDGAGNTTPDFSPDGGRLLFRSGRDGGGIYEIPAFGGQVRLVVREGLNPKVSPDGSLVAYWIGPESVAAAVPGSGSVWVVPIAGGQPRRVGARFTTARYPIWSPDGRHLLFKGYASTKAFDSQAIDWWLATTDGGEPQRIGVYDALTRAGLRPGGYARTPIPDVPSPGCWLADGNKVIFTIPSGDSQNLWEISLSLRTGRVIGPPRAVTTGPGYETGPSCSSGGSLAFTDLAVARAIWALPFDLNRGVSKGKPMPITQGPARRENPSFSKDGRYLAFVSDQSGPFNIWHRDLASGQETSVAGSTLVQRFPVTQASGSRVAYSVYEGDKRTVWVSSSTGGPSEKVCEGCLRATDWSRDGDSLLVFLGAPFRIDLLDVRTRRLTPLLKHPDHNLLYGRFSPDNRWVSFTARVEPHRGLITIAPTEAPHPIPERAWITVAEAEPDDYAHWSPDGNTVYFTSGQDGYSCLWGQRLDPVSRRPLGESFPVQHFHGRLSFGHGGWSVEPNRIAVALVEYTGNIWLMSRSGRR